MNNALTPFDSDGHPIRVLGIGGEPWFVLADLCQVLDHSNPRMAAARLDGDMQGVSQADTPGGRQNVAVVSEAGMYEVVIRSDKPAAAAFRRWATSDVLPAIRKTGIYATPQTVEAMLNDPDVLIQALTALKTERAARAEAEAELESARPKALLADAVATSASTILVGDLAKILRGNGIELGATRLFRWLRGNGYLIRREGTGWDMPTQRSMELGLSQVKETAVTHADGHVSVSKTPKVTGKGQRYFVDGFLSGRFNIDEGASA